MKDITRRIAQYARKVALQFADTPTEPYIPEMISRYAAQLEALYPKEVATQAVLNDIGNVFGNARVPYLNFCRYEFQKIRSGLAGDALVDDLNAKKTEMVTKTLAVAANIEQISLDVFGVPLV